MVGVNLAGFAAALDVCEDGVSVVMLEGLEASGGSSVMSGGCLAFACLALSDGVHPHSHYYGQAHDVTDLARRLASLRNAKRGR